MGNAEKAILYSLLIHVLLLAGIVLGLGHFNAPVTDAKLEISSVELSLSDDQDQSQRISSASPSMVAQVQKLSPRQESSPTIRQNIQGLPREPSPPEVPLAGEPMVEMHIDNSVKETLSEKIPAAEQAQVVSPAKLKQNIIPQYPRQARHRGEEGKVKLTVAVDVNGFVTGVSIALSSGFESLDAAAIKAVRAARFLPARNNDEPVDSNVALTLVFKLRK